MSQLKSDMRSRIKTTIIHDVEYENLLNKLLKDKVNLNGTEFKVDQKGLIWFQGRIYMPNIAYLKLFFLNEIQARWMYFVSEFNFEVKYIKGKDNRVDDALSR